MKYNINYLYINIKELNITIIHETVLFLLENSLHFNYGFIVLSNKVFSSPDKEEYSFSSFI